MLWRILYTSFERCRGASARGRSCECAGGELIRAQPRRTDLREGKGRLAGTEVSGFTVGPSASPGVFLNCGGTPALQPFQTGPGVAKLIQLDAEAIHQRQIQAAHLTVVFTVFEIV